MPVKRATGKRFLCTSGKNIPWVGCRQLAKLLPLALRVAALGRVPCPMLPWKTAENPRVCAPL
jgi:hypothetical protein